MLEKENKTAFLKKLGENIRKLRAERNMKQAELARLCLKDRQSLERVENGKTNASAYYLLQIAQALNVPLKDLFDFELPSKRE